MSDGACNRVPLGKGDAEQVITAMAMAKADSLAGPRRGQTGEQPRQTLAGKGLHRQRVRPAHRPGVLEKGPGPGIAADQAAAQRPALGPVEQLAHERQPTGMTKKTPLQPRQHPERGRVRPVVQPAAIRTEDLLAGRLGDHRGPERGAPASDHLRLAAERGADEQAHRSLRSILPPPVAQGVGERGRGRGPVRNRGQPRQLFRRQQLQCLPVRHGWLGLVPAACQQPGQGRPGSAGRTAHRRAGRPVVGKRCKPPQVGRSGAVLVPCRAGRHRAVVVVHAHPLACRPDPGMEPGLPFFLVNRKTPVEFFCESGTGKNPLPCQLSSAAPGWTGRHLPVRRQHHKARRTHDGTGT